jgi:uronate dehydrogenase
VYASSNWAVKALEQDLAPGCYTPEGSKIDSDAAPRPMAAYGMSKAMGEIMGRTLVDEGRLKSFVAARIGVYQPLPPEDRVKRHRWIGRQDLRSLLRRCVEAEFEGYHVVYGVSAQPEAPYDLSHTRSLLSWTPQERP